MRTSSVAVAGAWGRRFIAGFAVVLAAASGACSSSTDADGDFADGLTIGTGMSGFNLIGEGSTSSLSATGGGTLYFRLESASDIGTRFVRLYIYGSGGAPYGQKDVVPPQSYGHILLSSFRITDAGSYEVRGYLVDTSSGITETRIATATVTVTQ